MRSLVIASLLITVVQIHSVDVAPGAPTEDRVGFPKDYATKFQVLRVVERKAEKKVVTIYGNAPAASVTNLSQLPYPNGSVIVMETAAAGADEKGATAAGTQAPPRKEKVLGLHVMRREAGFGEAYGKNRTADWEYVEYAADGGHITPPAKTASCAECHVKAGAAKDFVYKARFGVEAGK